ncbi:hypothetical protein AB4059_00615 [Lysobacter sp. 2RAF19]
MHYGITTIATDFTEGEMTDWRVRVIKAILFFVPRANPDNECLYPQVRFWALELDEDGWPQREVGLDASRMPLFRAPDERNTGFWPDMAHTQFTKAELEAISENTFEEFWSGAPGVG